MKTINYYEEYEKYIINNEPIPYKNLLIYPVMWKDAYDFLNCCGILDINKDSTGDVNVISMSYLYFLLMLIQEEAIRNESFYNDRFVDILKLCLHIDINDGFNIEIDEKYKRIKLFKGDIVITEKDFDKIRKIILYQNIIGYDDSYIDPEVEKAIQTYYSIKNKGIEPPSLERIKGIMMSGGITNKNLLDMTYRDVMLTKDIMSDKIDYMTDKILLPHNDPKKPMKLEHWIFKNKKNKYEDAFVDAEAFKQKFS